eukprot:s1389_g27.t2
MRWPSLKTMGSRICLTPGIRRRARQGALLQNRRAPGMNRAAVSPHFWRYQEVPRCRSHSYCLCRIARNKTPVDTWNSLHGLHGHGAAQPELWFEKDSPTGEMCKIF